MAAVVRRAGLLLAAAVLALSGLLIAGQPVQAQVTSVCTGNVAQTGACHFGNFFRRELHGVTGGPGAALHEVKNAAGGAANLATGGFLGKFSPTNVIGNWAKSLGKAGGEYLAALGKFLNAGTRNDFGADWWRTSYAQAFGLGVVLFGFVQLYVFGRASRGDEDGVHLLRAAGIRAWFYVPAVAAGPALLVLVSQFVDDLSVALSQSASLDAGTALGQLGDTLNTVSPDHLLGGVISLLIFGLVTTAAGLVLLVEFAAREFGLYLAAAMVPLFAAAAVNPNWRRGLSRLLALIGGLFVMKPVTFFAFGLMWAAAAHVGDQGSLDKDFATLMFVAVAAVLSCAVPIVMAIAAPGLADALSSHGQATGKLQNAAAAPGRALSEAQQLGSRTRQWGQHARSRQAERRSLSLSPAGGELGVPGGLGGAERGSALAGAGAGAAGGALAVEEIRNKAGQAKQQVQNAGESASTVGGAVAGQRAEEGSGVSGAGGRPAAPGRADAGAAVRGPNSADSADATAAGRGGGGAASASPGGGTRPRSVPTVGASAGSPDLLAAGPGDGDSPAAAAEGERRRPEEGEV